MKSLFTIIIVSVNITTGEPNFINTGIQYDNKNDCLKKAEQVKDMYDELMLGGGTRMKVACIWDVELK